MNTIVYIFDHAKMDHLLKNDGDKGSIRNSSFVESLEKSIDDPEGHSLEFIAILERDAKPELGVVSYENRLNMN